MRAACDLARLLRDQGRATEACSLLAPVCAAFTEGFAFPDLVKAHALLEELGAAPADGVGHAPGEAPLSANRDVRGGDAPVAVP